MSIVIRELQAAPDVDALTRVAAVLLRGSSRFGESSRWSIVGFAPIARLFWTEGSGFVGEGIDTSRWTPSDPLSGLRQAMRAVAFQPGESALSSQLPFVGGAVGFLSFELMHSAQRVHRLPAGVCETPDLAWQFFGGALLVDHVLDRAWMVGVDNAFGTSQEMLDRCSDALHNLTPANLAFASVHGPIVLPDRDRHLRAVSTVREYIAAGDVYQVNLTSHFTVRTSQPSERVFDSLVREAEAPFSALLRHPEFDVMSVSPELFVRVDASGSVETRPIKGTRRRHQHPDADYRAAQELLHSEKDRAELAMIIDVHRNDLGRVCAFGSVETPTVFGLRTFPAVHHLEARVRGRLASNRDAIDVLTACTPAGSVSGAPKRRALEIISELEHARRGVYCGTLGYLDCRGGAELSVAIRTAVKRNGVVDYGAGGGIVWDSDPVAEYDEMITKAQPFIRAIEALHLDRRDHAAQR